MAAAPVNDNDQQNITIIDNIQNSVGKRVDLQSFKGTVRYVGPVATSKNPLTIWLGIEWDDNNRGKHDGAVIDANKKEHRYFQCPSGSGSFIKAKKANFGSDLLTVILAKFSLDDLDDDLKEQQKIAQQSNYKIEFVGWEQSIKKQCNIKERLSFPLENLNCSYIDKQSLDELKLSCKIVTFLDLRNNLITNINTLSYLYIWNNTLKELDLSFNKLNTINYKTISEIFDNNNNNKFNSLTFKTLETLKLNATSSNIFKPWPFVFILANNGCLPQLRELEICVNNIASFKLPAHIINNDLNGNPNDYGDADESKLAVPDGKKVAHIFSNLYEINLGENLLSDFMEIGDVFGCLPNLRDLKYSYTQMKMITFRAGLFMNLSIMTCRNCLFNDLTFFDEVNKFPNIQQLMFVECSFADVYGYSTLRDLAIGKIKNLMTCNGSIVNAKERHDAELFYLKWIMKQVVLNDRNNDNNDNDNDDNDDNDNDNDNDNQNDLKDNNDDDDNQTDNNNVNNSNDNNDNDLDANEKEKLRIDKLYPRYIELTIKHGAMNLNKNQSDKLSSVNIIIKSMDPESITMKPVHKKLPSNMTVSQLKLLCKRLFKLKPVYQRLMYREHGSAAFPDDMYNDTKSLSFYNIKDGTEILMQSTNFDKKNNDPNS